MRKNPFLKDEQEFRPLLMRGSLGNNFLDTKKQMEQELVLASNIRKETYVLNSISFDMIQPPILNVNGTLSFDVNVEMCSTECTQELFEDVMGFNPSGDKGGLLPVVGVSLYSCVLFCNKLSEALGYKPCYILEGEMILVDVTEQTGIFTQDMTFGGIKELNTNGFRLPTYDEWVIFARAGTKNRWAGTDDVKELGNYAWYQGNRKIHHSDLQQVATRRPNEWGLYDMNGNVAEWLYDERCADPDYLGVNVIGGDLTANQLGMSYPYQFCKSLKKRNMKTSAIGFRFVRTIVVKD